MKALKNKMGNKKGFTLVEMLIVVAIVAILIAISIPLVNSSLEKARHATDDANFRDAAALGTIEYLTQSADSTTTYAGGTYYYIVRNGAEGYLDTGKTGAYEAKCTCSEHGTTGGANSQIIQVEIKPGESNPQDIVTTSWVAKG